MVRGLGYQVPEKIVDTQKGSIVYRITHIAACLSRGLRVEGWGFRA